MQIEAIDGPALGSVARTDDAAVRALFAEQRGMLAVVRQNGIWDWLGGVPSGFGNPSAPLYSIYLAFGFVALSAVALVVAGFTRGPALWVVCGLAVLCLAARPMLTGAATRKTMALFQRGVHLPSIVLSVDTDSSDPDLTAVAVLVGMKVQSADQLNALVVAGGRVRDLLAGDEATPAELQSLVAMLRERTDFDGSRVAASASIGKDCEIAFLMLDPEIMPSEEVDSQLLFVFADPDCRDPEHTRIVQTDLWGHGAQSLCDSLPLEEDA